MADGAMTRADEARAKAYATPLDEFQVHAIDHFTSDTLWPWFERLRAEDPVHYTAESEYGPYWSITSYADIVACESDDGAALLVVRSTAASPCSSRRRTRPGAASEERASFIALDPPRHDAQRKAVAPIFSTPSLAELEPLIRARAAKILDELPIGEDLRLRRQGGRRADQPDAGDPVRLPVRAAPHAAAVLRHAALGPGRHAGGEQRAPGRDVRDRSACSSPLWNERARQPAPGAT